MPQLGTPLTRSAVANQPAIGWSPLLVSTLAPLVFNAPSLWNPLRPGRSEPPSPGWWRNTLPLVNPAILATYHLNNPLVVGRSEPPAYPRSVLTTPVPYSMGWLAHWDIPNYTFLSTAVTARTFIPPLPPVTPSTLIQRTLTGVGL